MKNTLYIWTLHFKLVGALAILLFASGCETKETPVKKIYKAKPVDTDSIPDTNTEEKEKPAIELPAKDSISITNPAPDSTVKNSKDTIETSEINSKKPVMKFQRRHYHYNIHRRGYIT